MIRSIGLASLTTTYFVVLSTAYASGGDHLSGATMTYGAGQQRCSEWNLSHTKRFDPLGLVQTSWVEGFVTGVGFFAPIKNTTGKDIQAFMNTYCQTTHRTRYLMGPRSW